MQEAAVYTEPIPIPGGYHLERRKRWAPRGDERPLVRDDAGHVLAVVDIYLPDVDHVESVTLTERER
jgi:hypothetical protein